MPRFPRRPRSKRGLLAAIGGTVAVVVVAAGALIYFVIFPTSSPKPFALTASTATQLRRTDRRSLDDRRRLAGRLPRA